jgi:hypothetical protein
MTTSLTDAEKLELVAAWILDDERNPGRNEVQTDLRRMAANLRGPDLQGAVAEGRTVLPDATDDQATRIEAWASRVLDIAAMARRRTGREPRTDRGWNWVCYCAVCRALRQSVS